MSNLCYNESISVAMAVYNGERFIEEQLQSILLQLEEYDELIISVNKSTDGTEAILSRYEKMDSRVHIYECANKGIISNFENALKHCSKEIIFLCDQDDIWEKEKISKVKEIFRGKQCALVMHNCQYVDAMGLVIEGNIFAERNASPCVLKNILRNSYHGCCLAFKRKCLDYILPIPKNVAMHDQWIGCIVSILGDVVFLDEKLIRYRIHDSNNSSNHICLREKIITMVNLMINLLSRRRQYKDGKL